MSTTTLLLCHQGKTTSASKPAACLFVEIASEGQNSISLYVHWGNLITKINQKNRKECFFSYATVTSWHQARILHACGNSEVGALSCSEATATFFARQPIQKFNDNDSSFTTMLACHYAYVQLNIRMTYMAYLELTRIYTFARFHILIYETMSNRIFLTLSRGVLILHNCNQNANHRANLTACG